jgi:hypothetical protein
MRNHIGTYVRRLLHAFAEVGYQPPTQDLQPLLGPSGAVMWTEITRVPGRQPSSKDRSTTADALPVPIESPPEVDIRRPELVGSTLRVPARIHRRQQTEVDRLTLPSADASM